MSLTLKGKISFDKANLPPYIYKFNIALITFFIGWFVVCAPAMIAVGYVYGESPITYIAMAIMFATFFLCLLIFCIVALRLRKKVVEECASRIEEQFADMPLEEATQILKSKGRITEYGFNTGLFDLYGEIIIPFEKAEFVFYPTSHITQITFIAEVYDSERETIGFACEVNRALFNFLDKSGLNLDLENNRAFVYLKNDKKRLCRLALGFRRK